MFLYIFAGYRLIPSLQQIYNSLTQITFINPSLSALVNDLKNLSETKPNINQDTIERLIKDRNEARRNKNFDMADEMADILWILICLANQTGTDLTLALENNFKKKDLRDHLRHKNNPKLK